MHVSFYDLVLFSIVSWAAAGTALLARSATKALQIEICFIHEENGVANFVT